MFFVQLVDEMKQSQHFFKFLPGNSMARLKIRVDLLQQKIPILIIHNILAFTIGNTLTETWRGVCYPAK